MKIKSHFAACALLLLLAQTNRVLGQADQIWAGHIAFGEGRYDEAVAAYQAAINQGSTWDWLPELIQTVKDRKTLGNIAPADTHKIRVIYVRTHNKITDTGTTVVRDVTGAQISKWNVFFALFNKTIEAFSNGAWTTKVDSVNAVSTFRADATLKPDNPDHLNLEQMFYATMNNYDSYITFSNTTSPALGLARQYPYVNSVIYGPHRGMNLINAGNHDYTVLLHEFFHIIEWVVNISPAHGFQSNLRHNFPGWTGVTEFNYYKWHFTTTLPGITWRKVNHRTRYVPFRTTTSNTSFETLRNAYTSIASRERVQAKTLAAEGISLRSSNPPEAAAKWEEALTLSPYNPDALVELHDYYRLTSINPTKSTQLYQKLKLIRDVHPFYTIDDNNKDAGKIAGLWHREDLTQTFTFREWDIRHLIKQKGCYAATFYYTSGFKALDIDSVSINGNGFRGSTLDAHIGFSGGNTKTNIVYYMNLPDYSAAANYTLRAKIRGNGGVDGYGQIHLKVVEDNLCPEVTSVEFETLGTNIQVYPNSSTGKVIVVSSKNANLSILAADGKVLRTGIELTGGKKTEIDNLASGVYLFRFSNGNGTAAKRVVIY